MTSGLSMASEDPGVSWPDFCRWPYSCNLWHQWVSKFFKHQKTVNFYIRFLTLKASGSHLVATRETSVGLVEAPLTGLQRGVGDVLVNSVKSFISTGHKLHHPHYAHFYCYFSHRFGIERVKSMLAKTGRNLTILIFRPKLIVSTPFLTFFHFKCSQPNRTLRACWPKLDEIWRYSFFSQNSSFPLHFWHFFILSVPSPTWP